MAETTLHFKVFGYDSEEVIATLQDGLSSENAKFQVETTYKDSLITVRCGEAVTERIYQIVYTLFEGAIYSDGNISLAARAVDYLRLTDKQLGVAESLTGGLICSKIVEVAGCGDVFYEGIISYSNIAKQMRLGVGRSTISAAGAVSANVCQQMAQGLLGEYVNIGVSTTGLAGPTGDSEDKPIGLTYIGITDEEKCDVTKHVFSGDREAIRNLAANTALFLLIKRLHQPTDFKNMVID